MDYSNIALKYNIPPLLLVGVINREVGGKPEFTDHVSHQLRHYLNTAPPIIATDKFGKANRTSFGAVSMQLRRAASYVDTLKTKNMNYYQFEQFLIQELSDEEKSIEYAAKHLLDLSKIDTSLIDKKNGADWSDERIAVVATRYNIGPDVSLDRLLERKEYHQYGLEIISKKDYLLSLLK